MEAQLLQGKEDHLNIDHLRTKETQLLHKQAPVLAQEALEAQACLPENVQQVPVS